MPMQNAPLQVNKFVRGLITEVSPLEFPPDASVSEKNFVLDKTGFRRRRLGLDYENGYSTITPAHSFSTNGVATQSFVWKDVGGNANIEFLVVQVGQSLMVFDYLKEVVSNNLLHTVDLGNQTVCQMASVDGYLVIANNRSFITILEYDTDTEVFTETQDKLKMRDLFGIQDPYVVNEGGGSVEPGFPEPLEDWFTETKDLLQEDNLAIRPFTLTSKHLYNLRNQGWGRTRAPLAKSISPKFKIPGEAASGTPSSADPVTAFKQYDGSRYPSNADIVSRGLIDDTEETPPITKFSPTELGKTPLLIDGAPRGFFIIDALDRGASRLEQAKRNELNTDNNLEETITGSFPIDRTAGGATCVEQFAGRLWYAGFSTKVTEPDNRSPRLASYVLFSQIVQNKPDIAKCYQKADPTFEEDNELVDTDGGFIKLDGAYGIKRLVNVKEALVVLAENGVWMIRGGDNVIFTATTYEVSKVTNQGCVSANSVVVVENSVMYWAENGIYHIVKNEFGDFVPNNLTENSIQRFFENIPYNQLLTCRGTYDRYDKTVRWLYGEIGLGKPSKELVLNVPLGAFYPLESSVIDAGTPCLLDYVLVPPYRVSQTSENVTVLGENVTAAGEQVTTVGDQEFAGTRETSFITLTSTSPVQIVFSSYRNQDFLDWEQYDNVGVDAPAHAVCGYITGGDTMRRKQAPVLFVFSEKTENGFTDVAGDWVANNESSCKVQAQWGWHNSPSGNRWGREFEAYRLSRFYLPEDVSDNFDTGEDIVVTRNKLRGSGKALSLKFSSSPRKDLRLYGWAVILGVSQQP